MEASRPEIVKIRAILVAASVVIGMSIGLYADETRNTRSPTHDAYVQYSANTSNNYGLNASMLVGRGREACMKFEVSDLANITAARLKLYVTGNTDLPSPFPVIVRTMFDDTWDEQYYTTSATRRHHSDIFRQSQRFRLVELHDLRCRQA